MTKTFTILVERDEEGWLVSEVVGLPGCHTQARSMDELITRTKEAIELYLSDADSGDYAARFVGMQQIEV